MIDVRDMFDYDEYYVWHRCCTAVERRDFLLIGVSADGFASLLDVESGVINASLPLPPPAHLRRNTNEETEAYKALVRCESKMS
jgi:hypothetical protein